MYYWGVARRMLGWWAVLLNNQSKPKNNQSIQFENLERLTTSMMKVWSSPPPLSPTTQTFHLLTPLTNISQKRKNRFQRYTLNEKIFWR